MVNRLKEIKNILLANDIKYYLNPDNLKNFSHCFKNYSKINFHKNTIEGLGKIKIFEPRKREAFNPGSKPLNFHTLWLSNHPDWKYYPKRDHSIIMMTNKPESGYGDNYYTMFIPNNTKVAVCQNEDLSVVFGDNIYSINKEINKIFEFLIANYKYDPNMIYDKFIEMVRFIDKGNLLEHLPSTSFFDMLRHEYNGLENYLTNFFDTSKVNLMNIEELIKSLDKTEKREIWVDVPCIGYNQDYFSEFRKDFNNILDYFKNEE